MDDDALLDRVWAGATEFQRFLGRAAKGGRIYEREGIVASVVPGVPDPFFNAAVLRRHADYPRALSHLAEFYAGTPKWGAWVDADNDVAAAALTNAGLVVEATPVLMATPLDHLALPKTAAATRPTEVDLDTVMRVNTIAYGEPEMTGSAFDAALPPHVRAMGVEQNDQIVAVMVLLDVEDDAFVTLVATLPDHRGQGHAATLIATALAHARERGQQTTTLQASKLGQNVYARLGYRALTEQQLWEMRA